MPRPRVGMWIVRGEEIVRVRDVPGQPRSPVVEGRLVPPPASPRKASVPEEP